MWRTYGARGNGVGNVDPGLAPWAYNAFTADFQFHFHHGMTYRICSADVHAHSAVRVFWIESANFEIAKIRWVRWESAQRPAAHFGELIVTQRGKTSS